MARYKEMHSLCENPQSRKALQQLLDAVPLQFPPREHRKALNSHGMQPVTRHASAREMEEARSMQQRGETLSDGQQEMLEFRGQWREERNGLRKFQDSHYDFFLVPGGDEQVAHELRQVLNVVKHRKQGGSLKDYYVSVVDAYRPSRHAHDHLHAGPDRPIEPGLHGLGLDSTFSRERMLPGPVRLSDMAEPIPAGVAVALPHGMYRDLCELARLEGMSAQAKGAGIGR